MVSCIFCQIVQGQAPLSLVCEDQQVLAFLDIRPVSPGHLLLIPKAHYAYLWEIPAPLCQAMAACLPRLAQALKTVTRAEAIDVFNLNGTAGGQSVLHMHVHLVPMSRDTAMFHRLPGEVLFRFHPRPAPRRDLDALAARLRQALGHYVP